MNATRRNIAVIGAGWAGCSAAVSLAEQGHAVTLYEASRCAGGRARKVVINDTVLDNGQHLLLGAYSASLQMMRTVGLNPDTCFLRLPLQMRYPKGSDGMDFIAPRLPAPWHVVTALLRAKGLSWQDKMALARFSSTARWMDWQLHTDCSVTELLQRYDQTDRLILLLWRPLCLAALNTDPDQASAQIFLNVLRDSLGAGRAASDMLIPRTDLSALFPQHAVDFVLARGGKIHYGAAVQGMIESGGQWRLASPGPAEGGQHDAVILATAPHQAARLLPQHPTQPGQDDIAGQLANFSYEPITTCYLQYAPQLRLPLPFMALLDAPARQHWGQFVFDRGYACENNDGLLAVIVSASTHAAAIGREQLGDAIARQLADALGNQDLLRPLWSSVITEKRATYSCRPALQRPPNATGLANLFLAGDYTQGDYPGTLEAAVRSGLQAAAMAGKN